MERGAGEFCSKWTLADTGNNDFGWLDNITDMDGMGAFLSTDEEMKWDKVNGCVYKGYTISEMSKQGEGEWLQIKPASISSTLIVKGRRRVNRRMRKTMKAKRLITLVSIWKSKLPEVKKTKGITPRS